MYPAQAMQTYRKWQWYIVDCSSMCKESETALLPHTDAGQHFSTFLHLLSPTTTIVSVFSTILSLSITSTLIKMIILLCSAELAPEGLKDLSLNTVYLLYCPHSRVEPFQPHHTVATDTQLLLSITSVWVSSDTPGQLRCKLTRISLSLK